MNKFEKFMTAVNKELGEQPPDLAGFAVRGALRELASLWQDMQTTDPTILADDINDVVIRLEFLRDDLKEKIGN